MPASVAPAPPTVPTPVAKTVAAVKRSAAELMPNAGKDAPAKRSAAELMPDAGKAASARQSLVVEVWTHEQLGWWNPIRGCWNKPESDPQLNPSQSRNPIPDEECSPHPRMAVCFFTEVHRAPRRFTW